jgi:hypothetical protein
VLHVTQADAKHLELTAFKQQSDSLSQGPEGRMVFEDEELAMSHKYDTSIMN